jgi:hypothetical protein
MLLFLIQSSSTYSQRTYHSSLLNHKKVGSLLIELLYI